MELYVFPLIFFGSLAGMAVLGRRYFSEIRKLSTQEVAIRLAASESVRRTIQARYLEPWRDKFYAVYLPAFWRRAEKTVRRLRILTMKFEAKLSRLSDQLRGKHVNLEIKERSEYWQALNGAKNNKKEEKE